MLKSAPIRIILGLLSAVAFFGLFYPFFVYLVFGISSGNFYYHWDRSKHVKFDRENRDDIFEGRPAKLRVCFVKGKQCSFSYETDEGRDVLAFCPENDKCYISLFKGAFSFFPEKNYEVGNRNVTEIDSFRVKLHGLATPFLENPGFYFFAMAFFAIAIGLCFLGIKNGIKKVDYLASLFFFVGLGLLIWWVVCYADSKILFLHFFVLTGIAAAVGGVLYKIATLVSKTEMRVRAHVYETAHKVKKHGKIHAELIRSDRAFEFIAKKFDEDSDAGDNWDALIAYIPFMAFSNRSFIVAEIGSPEWSIVYDHIQDYNQPFVKREIDGIESVITKVDSATKKQFDEITQEYTFNTYALLWLIAENDVNTPVVDEIYNLRKKYPCEAEKWYECETEFMLCEGDGLEIIWNRPNMTDKEFIDKIQEFCFEKNIGIEIEVVDAT